MSPRLAVVTDSQRPKRSERALSVWGRESRYAGAKKNFIFRHS
jgi:hypothetical protein